MKLAEPVIERPRGGYAWVLREIDQGTTARRPPNYKLASCNLGMTPHRVWTTLRHVRWVNVACPQSTAPTTATSLLNIHV
jgi:hypothetical protein